MTYMRNVILFGLLGLLFLISCVPSKKYEELQLVKDYYEAEADAADSIVSEYRKLYDRNRELEAELKNSYGEIEQLISTNISLNNAYLELLNRYNQTINNNNEVLQTYSFEKQRYDTDLAAAQEEIATRQQELEVMEYDLRQREQRLNTTQLEAYNLQRQLASRNQRMDNLQTTVQQQEQQLQELRQLRNAVNQNMASGVNSGDVNVTEVDGTLRISLSERLLFPTGSAAVNANGQRAIRDVANAIRRNPNLDVLVEGHTDNVGSAETNWDLSTDRATSVTKLLVNAGVAPQKITAAGRAFYQPIADNNSATGRARNRRVDIILRPAR